MVMSTKQRYAFICETKTDFVKGDDVPPLLEGLLSDIKAKYPTQINFVEQKKTTPSFIGLGTYNH